MRMPRVSLTVAMLGVVLVASNLAIYKFLSKGSDGTDFGYAFANSTWVTGNLLAILGYRQAARAGGRGAFATGLLIGGVAGVLAELGWMLAYPSARIYALDWTSQHFADYCMTHVPGAEAPLPDGGAYFRYWPVMALVFCIPQLIVTLIGGMVAWLMSGKLRAASAYAAPEGQIDRT